jgi:threonine/homoserine/homoserine lactone efflux protein
VPYTAVTVNAALGGGRRGGVFTALGVSCGQALWTLAASAGVAALLIASEPAFLAVKYVGAYLIYLRVHAINHRSQTHRNKQRHQSRRSLGPTPASAEAVVPAGGLSVVERGEVMAASGVVDDDVEVSELPYGGVDGVVDVV